MNAFDGIIGQDRVCSYLQAALDTQRTTHAYLLVGPDQAALTQIARHFAAALIAQNNAEVFSQALNAAHPDLHLMEPAGAAAYLIDQIRELVRDAELAPIRAPHKVYILQRADRLSAAPANALLKTLEEPPGDVVCILLAAHERAVLETVRSRCEVLHLRANQLDQPRNEEVFNLVFSVVSGADNRQVLEAAKRMVALANEGVDELEERYAKQLEEQGEFLTQGARKQLETQHKREVTAQVRTTLLAEVAAVKSWLRDCLLAANGAPEMAAHEHWSAQTMRVAIDAGAGRVLKALEAVKACEDRISYNVTPQLAVEALLFEIREAVCQ